MTSLVLPSAVTLLAHKRLDDTTEALDRKVAAQRYDTPLPGTATGSVRVKKGDTEKRVLALAKAAKGMLEGGPIADECKGAATNGKLDGLRI